MTLYQRVLLAKFDHDNMYSIGFAEAGKMAIEKRDSWTIEEFEQHLKEMKTKLIYMDEYEKGIISTLEHNIRELIEENKGVM